MCTRAIKTLSKTKGTEKGKITEVVKKKDEGKIWAKKRGRNLKEKRERRRECNKPGKSRINMFPFGIILHDDIEIFLARWQTRRDCI